MSGIDANTRHLLKIICLIGPPARAALVKSNPPLRRHTGGVLLFSAPPKDQIKMLWSPRTSKDPLARLADDARYMAGGAYPATVKDLTGIASDIQEVLAMYARLSDALAKIADGSTPPQPEGHYLAHRHAVNIAREALK